MFTLLVYSGGIHGNWYGVQAYVTGTECRPNLLPYLWFLYLPLRARATAITNPLIPLKCVFSHLKSPSPLLSVAVGKEREGELRGVWLRWNAKRAPAALVLVNPLYHDRKNER